MDSQEYYAKQVQKLDKAARKGKPKKGKAFKLQRKLDRKRKELRQGF